MNSIFNNLYIHLTVTFASYILGVYIQKKTKKAWLTPLIISLLIVVVFLVVFDIPYSTYMKGGSIISAFLTPITSLLALTIYRQRALIKKHFIPIFVGTLVGSIVSMSSVYLLCRVFHLDEIIIRSILAKGVTTPISMSVAESLGGIPGLAACSVFITGVTGNILVPALSKLFHFQDHTVIGTAAGTSSHAFGTIKAMEMGEDIGAISGIALSFSGIITALIAMLFS